MKKEKQIEIDWDLFEEYEKKYDVYDEFETSELELWQAEKIIDQYEELLTVLAHRYSDGDIIEKMFEIQEDNNYESRVKKYSDSLSYFTEEETED